VYGIGLLMYELFTGGGPHLSAPWSRDEKDHRDEHLRLKQALRFPPPSEAHNEIRFDFRWLDAVILRCLEVDPARRFRDAGQLLAGIETCEAGSELPPPESAPEDEASPTPPIPDPQPAPDGRQQELFREVRRLLATRAFDEVIDRLDVHRPAEWAVVDADGGRTLHLLGQAYLGRGDLAAARDCLEQLRTAQQEQPVLPPPDYAAALSDLVRCYRGLGQMDLAETRREEAHRLLCGTG
jgi:hypothetical protein